MTDADYIIIGVEDRLKLADLTRELADAQWVADNPWVAHGAEAILISVFCAVLLILLAILIIENCIPLNTTDGYYDEKRNYHGPEYSRPLIPVVIVSMLPVIATAALTFLYITICHEFDEKNVMVIQTEIDEIKAMWGLLRWRRQLSA